MTRNSFIFSRIIFVGFRPLEQSRKTILIVCNAVDGNNLQIALDHSYYDRPSILSLRLQELNEVEECHLAECDSVLVIAIDLRSVVVEYVLRYFNRLKRSQIVLVLFPKSRLERLEEKATVSGEEV